MQEWRSLSKKGSLIRSARIQQIDQLLARYHESEKNQLQRLSCIARLLDVIVEYRQEAKGSRVNAVMLLGKEVLSVVKNGVRNYTTDSWTDEKLGKAVDFNRQRHYA